MEIAQSDGFCWVDSPCLNCQSPLAFPKEVVVDARPCDMIVCYTFMPFTCSPPESVAACKSLVCNIGIVKAHRHLGF